MTGNSVFAALALARVLAGPGRQPERVPEPEFRPMFPRRPPAAVPALDAEVERVEGPAAAALPSGRAA
jgi:hypothetical protein